MKSQTGPRRYTQTARAQAAEATAQRIVDAFLARLMEQWFDEITLDRVAQEAGCTVQTVVRRFGGKEGLLAEAAQAMDAQVSARRASPPGDIARLVENLVADYEHSGDGVIRLLALEPRHPALASVMEFGRGRHRAWVASVFGEPLEKLEEGPRNRALDALVVVTDVYVWKLLRRDMQHSRTDTATALNRLVRSTLREFTNHHGEGE